MAVQHIVLFSFPRELSADEAADMRRWWLVARRDRPDTATRARPDLTGALTRG